MKYGIYCYFYHLLSASLGLISHMCTMMAYNGLLALTLADMIGQAFRRGGIDLTSEEPLHNVSRYAEFYKSPRPIATGD